MNYDIPPRGAEDHYDLSDLLIRLNNVRHLLALRGGDIGDLAARIATHVDANRYADGSHAFDSSTLKNAASEVSAIAQDLDLMDRRLEFAADQLKAVRNLWRDEA